MKEISGLVKGQYSLLLGAITYKGAPVLVYDEIVPISAVAPYIIIANIDSNPYITTNTNYIRQVVVLLDIVTSYEGPYGGKTDCLAITDLVFGIMIPGRPMDPKPLYLGPNFKVITTTVQHETSMPHMNDTRIIVRNLVRFQHIIEQRN